MSFSVLRDIFVGRLGTHYCAKSVLFLKSPDNVKEYLIGIHKVAFPQGDTSKSERWDAYPHVVGTPSVIPIKEKDLSDRKFMNKQARKLSFDISRFIEFLVAHARVDDDIKPIMLHYSVIYLFDFFSRTWLKYGRNPSHGIKKLRACADDYTVTIQKSGIFPRAVDAFYLLNQSSIFSIDDDDGIPYQHKMVLEIPFKKIDKMKYSECPEINLTHLTDIYERLHKIEKLVSKSNLILPGYAILFVMSSISRYRAEDWFKIREDINFKSKFDLLQYDFLYNWIPEILIQTILRKDLKKELSLPSE